MGARTIPSVMDDRYGAEAGRAFLGGCKLSSSLITKDRPDLHSACVVKREVDVDILRRHVANARALTANGPPSPTSNPFFGVGPITDGTGGNLDGRLRRFEFEQWLERTYRKRDALGHDIGGVTAAELGRSMHRGAPADEIILDMMRMVHRYFGFPAQNRIAVGLGGGHSGFSVCMMHLIDAADAGQRIYVDTPHPESDASRGTGFFRRSWAQQVLEIAGEDPSRVLFAEREGEVPDADRLDAAGVSLFVGVGHETTSATAYSEAEVCELLGWLDRDPESRHAVIDATSMLGAMPWSDEIVSAFMARTCMFFPLQKAVGGVPGYFLISFTPEALRLAEANQNPPSLAIPRQLKLTVPVDPYRPVSGAQTLATGPFYDPAGDKMTGGVINTFSPLAFAETTFGLLKLQERCGTMQQLNRSSLLNRQAVDRWTRENPLLRAVVPDDEHRGAAVTLLRVNDPDIVDPALHERIIAGAKKILGHEGLVRADGSLEPGLDTARYVNPFPGTGGDFRAWIGGIRTEADIIAFLDNLKYAYLRAKVVVLEQELQNAGEAIFSSAPDADAGRGFDPDRAYTILIADSAGLRLDASGKPDVSEVRDHVLGLGATFVEGGLPASRPLEKGKLHFFHLPEADLASHLGDLAAAGLAYDAVIAAGTQLPRDASFAEGGVRIGSGTDNMLCASWGGRDGGGSAPLMNTPGVNATATAHTVMKAVLRRIPGLPFDELHQRVVSGTFDTRHDLKGYPSRKLEGMRYAVIGFGHVGRKVARIAAAFDMDVVVFARGSRRLQIELAGYRYAASIEAACASADVVSIHLGLGAYDETRRRYANQYLFGERELSSVKPGALLVNYDRAELVDAAALGRALDAGLIGHASFDADIFFERRTGEVSGPLAPFRDLAIRHPGRIHLLPHAAADTDHPTRVAGAKQAVDQIVAAIRHRRVSNGIGALPAGYEPGPGAQRSLWMALAARELGEARLAAERLSALFGALASCAPGRREQEQIDREEVQSIVHRLVGLVGQDREASASGR